MGTQNTTVIHFVTVTKRTRSPLPFLTYLQSVFPVPLPALHLPKVKVLERVILYRCVWPYKAQSKMRSV